MALYEMRDGRIGVWRDFTDSKHANQLLEATKPIGVVTAQKEII
jgi:limonene-1,2-epoxide hydrolase